MTAESLEVRLARQYLFDSGIAHRVTSTTNHSVTTTAGHLSYHRKAGTDGPGLALDAAGPVPGRDSAALGAIFWSLEPVFGFLHELIYAGPQTTFNIKDGKRVAKYAASGHHDHVHVSFKKGVFLSWPHPGLEDDTIYILGKEYPMAIFKNVEDAERAYVRDLYLQHLHREPESLQAQDMWRLELHQRGGDWVMAAIADSDEAVGWRKRNAQHLGA